MRNLSKKIIFMTHRKSASSKFFHISILGLSIFSLVLSIDIGHGMYHGKATPVKDPSVSS